MISSVSIILFYLFSSTIKVSDVASKVSCSYSSPNGNISKIFCNYVCCSDTTATSLDQVCCSDFQNAEIISLSILLSLCFLCCIFACCCICVSKCKHKPITPTNNGTTTGRRNARFRFHRFNLFSTHGIENPTVAKDDPPSYIELYENRSNGVSINRATTANNNNNNNNTNQEPQISFINVDQTDNLAAPSTSNNNNNNNNSVLSDIERISSPPPSYGLVIQNRGNNRHESINSQDLSLVE